MSFYRYIITILVLLGSNQLAVATTAELLNSTSSAASTITSSAALGQYSSLVCDAGLTPTNWKCKYSQDVIIPYFLSTTITLTAATVYLEVANGTTRTRTKSNNLNSTLNHLSTALVPSAQIKGEGPWMGVSAVELVFGTTQSTTFFGTAPFVLTAGDVYLAMIGDIRPAYDYMYECAGLIDGKSYTRTAQSSYDIQVPQVVTCPANDPTWKNMTTFRDETVTTANWVDALIFKQYPMFPICNGTFDGFPSPKVVVSVLTETSNDAASQQAATSAAAPAKGITAVNTDSTTIATSTVATRVQTPTVITSFPTSTFITKDEHQSASGFMDQGHATSSGGIAIGDIIASVLGFASVPSGLVINAGNGKETTYTVISGSVAIGSTVLSINGPAATVNGMAVTLGPSELVIGSSTYAVSAIPSQKLHPDASTSQLGAVLTVGGVVYTATQGNALVIGSTTLTVGGSASTISGTIVSVGSSGVVIGSSTAQWSTLGQNLRTSGRTSSTLGASSSMFTEALSTSTRTESKPVGTTIPASTRSSNEPRTRRSDINLMLIALFTPVLIAWQRG